GGGFTAGNGKVTLSNIPNTIATLRGSYSTSGVIRPNTKISIFRNAPSIDVAIFYKITELLDTPAAANQTYVDATPDLTISSGQKVYTSGGVLDKECPPPSSHLVLHQNAVWGISTEDPQVVFYSGDYLQGIAPWFSSGFQVRCDQAGACTALA